jgi:hypothetical protein
MYPSISDTSVMSNGEYIVASVLRPSITRVLISNIIIPMQLHRTTLGDNTMSMYPYPRTMTVAAKSSASSMTTVIRSPTRNMDSIAGSSTRSMEV